MCTVFLFMSGASLKVTYSPSFIETNTILSLHICEKVMKLHVIAFIFEQPSYSILLHCWSVKVHQSIFKSFSVPANHFAAYYSCS